MCFIGLSTWFPPACMTNSDGERNLPWQTHTIHTCPLLYLYSIPSILFPLGPSPLVLTLGICLRISIASSLLFLLLSPLTHDDWFFFALSLLDEEDIFWRVGCFDDFLGSYPLIPVGDVFILELDSPTSCLESPLGVASSFLTWSMTWADDGKTLGAAAPRLFCSWSSNILAVMCMSLHFIITASDGIDQDLSNHGTKGSFSFLSFSSI